MADSTTTTLAALLKARFAAKQVDSLIEHYQTMVSEFQKGEWEKAIIRSGKFVEATLKALWLFVGNPLPRAREFKVDFVIRELEKIPAANADDTVRISIPRACRFVYDIASNRGSRHDNQELNPNEMDANAVIGTCSWVLAEMVRFSQAGVVDTTQAREMVVRLTQKKFPVMEDVDGRVYFHLKGLSARDVALLTLWNVHPARLSKQEVIDAAKRHGSSLANAKMGVSRLDKVVDDDGQGNLRLLTPGVSEAEQLLATGKSKFVKE
ncbi:MAG TPA: hypothetical protein VK828_03480 [Terriglobales bacterium]|jgi:hypothetical protein|nr:hypothetical protein [Terriglobales bacterium]